MMFQPTHEELEKLLEIQEKWLTWDENNHLIFKPSAPQEARDFREKMQKKYRLFD